MVAESEKEGTHLLNCKLKISGSLQSVSPTFMVFSLHLFLFYSSLHLLAFTPVFFNVPLLFQLCYEESRKSLSPTIRS